MRIIQHAARFPLGRMVATPGALQAMEDAEVVCLDYLARHASGDWGEVDEHDTAENELSVKQGYRIMSAYTLPTKVKIWVITEADRSATTILLPEEY